MHSDGTGKARAADAVTEGIGNAGFGSQALTILMLQDVVIWTPSQIFEKSEEGAKSRKRVRPFAFGVSLPLSRSGLLAALLLSISPTHGSEDQVRGECPHLACF